jgi:two-component system, NarL family, sensor kinase
MVGAVTSTRRAVLQFALSGLAAVALLGLVSVEVLRRTGTRQAVRDAREVTRLAGDGIIAPDIGPGVLAGRPAALRRLDRIVRRRVLRDPVVRVKLWAPNGRILYSDEPRLIGRRYRLGGGEDRTLRHGGTDAEVSDLARPENVFERGHGKLLEVYHGIRAAGGRRLLFEAYLRYSAVSASARRLWISFLPALAGALLLLELVQIPLAVSLARRIRRGQREREALLHRAVEASDLERRRIARDLHDGPVQDLAGVGFALGAASQRLRAAGDPDGAEAVDGAAAAARGSVRALRSLLVELYPPDLRRAGLAAALSDLVAPLRANGVDAHAEAPPDLDLSATAEAVLFRVAQEGVRNVLAHAGADHATVRAVQVDSRATLVVVDDGRGFEPDAAPGRDAGHFGLGILEDLVREAGGTLRVESRPGEGTRLEAEVPTR